MLQPTRLPCACGSAPAIPPWHIILHMLYFTGKCCPQPLCVCVCGSLCPAPRGGHLDRFHRVLALSVTDISDLLQLLRELLERPYIRKCGVGIHEDMQAVWEFFNAIGHPFKPECVSSCALYGSPVPARLSSVAPNLESNRILPAVVCSGIVDFQKVCECKGGLQGYAVELLRYNIVKAQRDGAPWIWLPLNIKQTQYAVDDAWIALMIVWAMLTRYGWSRITPEQGRLSQRQQDIIEAAAQQLPQAKQATGQRCIGSMARQSDPPAPQVTVAEAEWPRTRRQPPASLRASTAACAAHVPSAPGAGQRRGPPSAHRLLAPAACAHPEPATPPGATAAPRVFAAGAGSAAGSLRPRLKSSRLVSKAFDDSARWNGSH